MGGSWRCSREDSSRLLPGTECPAPPLQMFLLQPPVELGKPETLVFLPQHLWETSSSSFLQLQSTALSPSDAHQSPLWLAVSLAVKSEKHFQQFLGSAVLLIAVGHMTLMLLADTQPLGSQLILEDP